jgi:hypothetical protein
MRYFFSKDVVFRGKASTFCTTVPVPTLQTGMWLLQRRWKLMDQDHSCSDLASSDFNLIGPLKEQLAGEGFATGTDVKRALSYWLWTRNTVFINSRIQALVPMRDKCLNISGHRFGVWCALSATRVPCIHRNQTNVLGIKLFVNWILTVYVLRRCTSLHSETRVHALFGFSALVIGPSQRPLPENTRHSQGTDIHAAGGIRTGNPSKQVAADPSAQTARPPGSDSSYYIPVEYLYNFVLYNSRIFK